MPDKNVDIEEPNTECSKCKKLFHEWQMYWWNKAGWEKIFICEKCYPEMISSGEIDED